LRARLCWTAAVAKFDDLLSSRNRRCADPISYHLQTRQKQRRWKGRDVLSLNPKLAHMCDVRRRRCMCAKDVKKCHLHTTHPGARRGVGAARNLARAAASASPGGMQNFRRGSGQALCEHIARFLSHE
jgi:hypothetical protein